MVNRDSPPPRASIPDSLMLVWDSQVKQYPKTGPPGISYFEGVDPNGGPSVDCLLYRSIKGKLQGILNYYAVDFPPYERAGNANVFVSPAWRRKGIATELLAEAIRRWPINLEQQRYSESGALFIRGFLEVRE